MMSDNDPRDYRTLGDLLRDAREERKLDHEQVNEATKISPRVLEALEKDDLEGASGVVYARGFVRTLAKFYDLDPEWLGAKLDQLAGETSRPVLPVEDDDGVIAGPVGDAEVESSPVATAPKWEVESTRVRKVGSSGGTKVPRNLIYGMVAVLVVAIVLVVWMSRGNDRSPDQGSQRTPAAVGELAGNDEDPAPVRSPELGPGDESEVSQGAQLEQDRAVSEEIAGTFADTVEVVQAPTEVVVADVPDSPIDQAPPAEEWRDPEPLPTRPEPDPEPEPVSETQTDTGTTPEAVEMQEGESAREGGLASILRPDPESPAPVVLLRVIADAPVEVTLSSDGSSSEVRFLQAGQEWVMEGRDHFSISVSDPSAIRLEMNGRESLVPSSWIGEERILYPPGGDG
jgi:cytoskeletal protein RodZ